MKVLLIGFSKQSANVLDMYMKRDYPMHDSVVIERSFGDNLLLSLPKLSDMHTDAKAMIISLEGVGMMSFSKECAKNLQHFIGARTALLVVRGDLSCWQSANMSSDEPIFFLKSPFDKQAMTYTVKALLEAGTKVKSISSVPYLEQGVKQHSQTQHTTEQATQDSQNPNPKPVSEPESILFDTIPQDYSRFHTPHFLHKLLDRYFDLPKQALLHEMLDISLFDEPIKLSAGSQSVYLNKHQNMALVHSIERLVDYCVVANNCQILSNVIRLEIISEDKFAELTQSKTYKKYPLNNLLWQMQSALLPEKIHAKEHNLLLKMRYMPNFSQMKGVPDYVRDVAAASLVAPRSFNQLAQMTTLGQDAKPLLDRVLLLAILSGAADESILRQSFGMSFENVNEKAKQATTKQNEGVKKASSTGFLRRLLEKLNLVS